MNKLGKGGYPDNGNGYYSQKLPYKTWFEYNTAVRVHQNMIEQMPFQLTFLLVGGYMMPKWGMIASWVAASARAIYTIMYTKYGPGARYIGSLLGGLFILTTGLGGVFFLAKDIWTKGVL